VESDVPYRSELCGVRVELDKLDNAEAHREARVSAGPVEREVGYFVSITTALYNITSSCPMSFFN